MPKQTVQTLRLSTEENRRFAALAQRLDLTPDDAAARLINAAVEALEGEDEFVWPLYLVQSGNHTVTIRRR